MASKGYFAKGDKQYGPFSPNQPKQLAASGMLLPEDCVRCGGFGDWTPAASIVGLFGNPGPVSDTEILPEEEFTRFPCPQCAQRLKAPVSAAGKKCHCPRCGARTTVSSSSAEECPDLTPVVQEEIHAQPAVRRIPRPVDFHPDQLGLLSDHAGAGQAPAQDR